jgi:hypothetical protein
MKRRIIFVSLAFIMAVFSYAGDRRDWRNFPPPHTERHRGWDRRNSLPPPRSAETVTVTGALGIARGLIALTDKDITYYAPSLHRYAGFIDGLKEGAEVTLAGRTIPADIQDEASKILIVTKLTINGKDYDLNSGAIGSFAAPPRQPGPAVPHGCYRN